MNQPLRLGIAGLGTVGAGVVKIIQSKSELLRTRTGRDIEIVAVSARSAGKDRGVDLSAYRWYDCLLYTSPSPRDLSTSRMPSSA